MSTSKHNSNRTRHHDDLSYQQQHDNDSDEFTDAIDYDNIDTTEGDDNDGMDKSYLLKPIEEHALSQKMSQLLTTVPNEEGYTLKYMKDELDKIPSYLIKRNPAFQQMLRHALSTMTVATSKNNTREELRKIAILIYKIKLIQMYQTLWTTYFKSGMGQLITQPPEQLLYPTNIPVWPKEMKIILQLTNINETDENELCITAVKNHRQELDNLLKHYHTELNKRKKSIDGFTFAMQQTIEIYIEQHFSSVRIEIEHKMALIHYNYHIRALKLTYAHHHPNEYQKQLMKQLCQDKYEQEITAQELNLLRQKIMYSKALNQPFERSPLYHSIPCLRSIESREVREQIFNQFKDLAEKMKASVLSLYTTAAQTQRDECKLKFDTNLKKMWSDRHLSANDEKIPLIMIQMIAQRYDKISERIQCIYKFRVQSLISKSVS